MAVFYICRHGQTENNKHGRLSGWIDTPLTGEGLADTKSVIAHLKNVHFDAMYASDLGRAFITAYDVARGINFSEEIVRLPGLREVNYGDAANMKTSEAYALYPRIDRDTHFTPPNGESLHHMQTRVIETISELNAAHPDVIVLIVTHSGVMAALNSSLTGQDFGAHNISEAYPHDYIAKCTVKDDKVTSFERVA